MAKENSAVAETQPIYSAAELSANAPRLFGQSIDIASAALDFAKIKECTIEEARNIIKEFAERKVK